MSSERWTNRDALEMLGSWFGRDLVELAWDREHGFWSMRDWNGEGSADDALDETGAWLDAGTDREESTLNSAFSWRAFGCADDIEDSEWWQVDAVILRRGGYSREAMERSRDDALEAYTEALLGSV